MTMRHQPSCQVLNVRDNLMMIDCGEGAQLGVRRTKLKLMRLNHIFISHLHGDHCFGLPGLVSTMALLNRSNSLTIHTFKDGVDLFSRMLTTFAASARSRCASTLSTPTGASSTRTTP